MSLHIPEDLLNELHTHGENAYPEEGAGFLLGVDSKGTRDIKSILTLANAREDAARHNRYLLTARDMLYAEQEAARQGLDVVGVFHSHPDHPDQPSEFDREWAMPWFSYLITSVVEARAISSRSWRLREDRSAFTPEEITIADPEKDLPVNNQLEKNNA